MNDSHLEEAEQPRSTCRPTLEKEIQHLPTGRPSQRSLRIQPLLSDDMDSLGCALHPRRTHHTIQIFIAQQTADIYLKFKKAIKIL
jgi:hypothetical protein